MARTAEFSAADGLAAAARGSRLRSGGALTAVGAGAWIAHGVLMLVGMVALLGSSLTSPQGTVPAAIASSVAYLAATIAVLLGSVLLGTGLVVCARGLDDLAHTDGTGRRIVPSAIMKSRGTSAGVAVVVYGILGIVAVGLLAQMVSAGTSLQLERILGLFQATMVLWVVAAVLLVAAAALTSSFLRSLGKVIGSAEGLGGGGFLAYAIVNAVGVVLFAIPLLLLVSNPTPGTFALAVVVLFGAFLELFVVPIVGIVAFGLLIGTELRMRRLASRSGGTMPPVPVPPVPAFPPISAADPPPRPEDESSLGSGPEDS